MSPEAGVEPAAVLIVAAEEAVLHPPPVPVTEPPASVAPVGEPPSHFTKLNINIIMNIPRIFVVTSAIPGSPQKLQPQFWPLS